MNFKNLAYQLAISTDKSDASDGEPNTAEKLDYVVGDLERRDVRNWMKQHCPEATIPAADSELMASILTGLMQHENPWMTFESVEECLDAPAEPGLFAMLSPRTRCYVKFPKRAATDLVGYAGLAWEIFKLLQGEPLDLLAASVAVTASAMERIRFLSKPELKIVAFVIIRDKDSINGVHTLELEQHWGSEDENLFRETLEKLVKRVVLVHTQQGYSLAA